MHADAELQNNVNDLFGEFPASVKAAESVVFSEKDMQLLNAEFRAQLKNKEKRIEKSLDELWYSEDDDDDDDDDQDYKQKDGTVSDSGQLDENDDGISSYIDSISNDKTIATSDDEEDELDQTMFLYDPPVQYKNKVLLIIFKYSPLILIVILLLSLMGVFFQDKLPQLNLNDPFLSHKIYVLEEDIKSLQNMKSLDKDVKYLKDSVSTINSKMSIHNLSILDEKIKALELKIDKISKLVENQVHGFEQVDDIQKRSLLNRDESIPHSEKQVKSFVKYFNIANKFKINKKSTTHQPSLARRKRNSAFDRIVHGFPDLFKRVMHLNKELPVYKTIDNINLLSSSNSPRNVLTESSTMHRFWQIPLTGRNPIFFTLSVDKPIKLHEIGINHMRNPLFSDQSFSKRWPLAAPKNIEFFVKLHNMDELTFSKSQISKYYNQNLKKDLPFDLSEWIRVGNLTYDIGSFKSYQSLNWNKDVENIIESWEIDDIMLIIYDNHGDEMLVLDSLRIYSVGN